MPADRTSTATDDPVGRVGRAHVLARVRAELLGRAARPRFGRFTLLRLLGEGGQGQVYEAHDPRLDRAVALKIRRANSRGSAARALDEGRALARLRHQNLIPIFEVVEDDDACGLVMELADGETLRAWLRRRPSRAAVLRVLIGVGRGLVALHAVGIVHRDVKPGNVVVGPDATPRLVDLGLACDAEPAVGARARRGGTPHYMAPEQRLDAGNVGAAVDQYAFAVVAWEALTGRRPSRTPARDRGCTPSPDLAAVLIKALAVDPAARHRDMNALVGAFEAAVTDAHRRGRRWRVAAWVGGLATLASVGASTVQGRLACEREAAAPWTTADREALRTELAGVDVPAAAHYADVVVQQLDRRARSIETLDRALCDAQAQGRPVARQRACLDEYVAVFPALVQSIAASDAASLPDATGRIARVGTPEACEAGASRPVATEFPAGPPGGAALRELDVVCDPHAGTSCDASIDALVRQLAAEPRCTYEPQLTLRRAEVLATTRRAKAIELVADAAWAAERCGLDHTELRAKTLAAHLSSMHGETRDAAFWLAASRAALARIGATDERRAWVEGAAAEDAFDRGETADALEHRLRAVALLEASGSAAQDELQIAYVNAGRVALATGDAALAIDLVGRGLAQLESVHGTDHPLVARVLGTLAHAHSNRGEYRIALGLLERASTILERWDRPLLLAAALNNRATVHQRLEEDDAAIALMERSYRIKVATLPPDDPRLVAALSNVGRAMASAGEVEAGITRMRDALARARERHGETDDDTLLAKSNLASTLFNTGGFVEAGELACDVASIRHGRMSMAHPDLFDAWRLCLRSIDAAHVSGQADSLDRYTGSSKDQENPAHPPLAGSEASAGGASAAACVDVASNTTVQ